MLGLKDKKNYKSILAKLEDEFYSKYSLFVITAAELEFYLSDNNKDSHTKITEEIYSECHNSEIPIEKIIKEQGENQFEVIFPTFRYATETAKAIIRAREIITEIASKYSEQAYLDSKPFNNRPASGLHIHISIHNDELKNAFAKARDDEETDYMIYSANGLCALMSESMIFFAPDKDDYTRYSIDEENLVNATEPLYVCWGGNNRSTSIRIPSSTINPNERNIEHRVPCPNSDPYKVLAAIIVGIDYGIDNKITEYPKIFGNAFDKQYKLTPLPKSLKEAKKAYKNSNILKNIL